MSDTQAMIDDLWAEFAPLVESRITAIADLAEALGRDGEAAPAVVAAAQSAAHNLVGALGTYGRAEGSAVASAIEDAVKAGASTSAALHVLLGQLRAALDDHT